jgi:hypothetical protein
MDPPRVSFSPNRYLSRRDCTNPTRGERVTDLDCRAGDSGTRVADCGDDVYDLSRTVDYGEFTGGGDETGDVYCGWSCW